MPDNSTQTSTEAEIRYLHGEFDQEAASRFLSLLDEDDARFTFQTFDDNQDRRDPTLTCVLHGTLEQHWDELTRLNGLGAGIYVNVNRTDLKGRKAANITGIRAIWQEDDGEGKPLPVTPHIRIETSPGHFHCYILTESDHLAEFIPVQQRMSADYGSDPAANTIERVLRVPGFYHTKISSKKKLTGKPFMVKIVEASGELPLPWDEVIRYFPPVVQQPSQYDVSEPGTDPITSEQEAHLRSALDYLPSDDRVLWVAIGQALKKLGQLGFKLWDAWSQKSGQYDADDQESRWAGFSGDHTSYRAVFKHAQDAGWENPASNDIDDFIHGAGGKGDDVPPLDDFDWLEEFELTEAEADEIADPKWIYENLLIQGHVIAVPAPPNGGKTTILFHIAQEIVKRGYQVIYVNADISGGDAKPMRAEAKKTGVRLLLPDMKQGKNMDEVVNNFARMDQSSHRFDSTVVFFDTLKKMTDVIHKNKAKELYKLLRSLSAKGMTIVLLAHTNKYPGEDGKLIYEGTGDLRSDVDELIYFEPTKHDDKSMTVTTVPDKVRGTFEPITFHIDPFRNVTQADDVVDTHAINELHKKIHQDRPVIDLIDDAIDAGKVTGKDIKDYVKEQGGVSWRPVERVLKTYSRDMTHALDIEPEPHWAPGLYWIARRGVAKSLRYTKAQN